MFVDSTSRIAPPSGPLYGRGKVRILSATGTDGDWQLGSNEIPSLSRGPRRTSTSLDPEQRHRMCEALHVGAFGGAY